MRNGWRPAQRSPIRLAHRRAKQRRHEMKDLLFHLATTALALVLAISSAPVLADDAVFPGKPQAVIDLATRDGAALVKGQWRYSDTRIVETDFYAAGADGQPGDTPVKAYDYSPKAGGVNFDDSGWEVIEPSSLDKRRTNGRLAFNWYRIKLTIPERVGGFDPTGSTVVFETSADDYAEVWVDGELP